MPLYRYACSACGGEREENRRISDRDDRTPVHCFECQQVAVFERILESPAFHLKGAGWHNLEYNKHRRRKD